MNKVIFALLSCSTLVAAELPGGLSPMELERLVEVVGFTSSTKVMRSAEAYPAFPGFKIGIETTGFSAKEINQLGNGTGQLPSFVMIPRLYLAKGLFFNVDLVVNYALFTNARSAKSYGGALKWTFWEEWNSLAAVCAFAAFQQVSAFDVYSGNSFEFGLIASKDFVALKPYLGIGALRAQGQVPSTFALGDANASKSSLHFFVGTEIEWILNFTLQADFINLSPRFSLLVSVHV